MMQLSLHIGSRRQSLSPRSTCRNNCQLSAHDLGRSHDRRTLEGRGTLSEKTDKITVKNVKLRRSLQGKCTEIPDRTALCSLFCAVVSGLVYVNSLDGELVHDDLSAIRDNPDVVDSVWIFELFRNDFWGMPMRNPESHKSYRPLTTLTFKLNYVFHGFAPRGYHLVNILLHATTTGLFVDTAVRCLESSLLSATIAGVLFAIHPVHTEAVSGIVGRADILATMFFILSFRAYYSCIRSDGDGAKQRHHRLKSVLLAGISMLCKEHGLTVIAVSSLWDVIISKQSLIRTFISTGVRRDESGNFAKPQMNSLTRAASLISMGTPLLLFRVWIMGSELPNFSDQENPAAASPFLLTRFLTWFYLPVLNLFLLFCPVWLSYDWQLGTVALVESVTDLRFTIATIVYLSLATLAWKLLLSGKPADIWCLLTLVIPFLPAANIIAPVGFVLAERLLYLPSLGFCLLVGQGFDRLWNRCHVRDLKVSLLLSIAFVFAVFCGKTWTRNVDWLSRETLFRSGLKSFPCNAKMHYNFANLQKDEGRPEAAVLHYQEALRLWPSHASAHNNLGTLLSDLEAAKVHFEEALKIHPRHANALYNLAAIHRKGGNTTTAVRLLESCLKVEPFHKEALMMMADILTDKGDIRRVYIVNLFIKEAHRRRGKRQTETSELWNNLSRTVDAPLRHNGEPPNILQYLNANSADGKRFFDHPISGFHRQR